MEDLTVMSAHIAAVRTHYITSILKTGYVVNAVNILSELAIRKNRR